MDDTAYAKINLALHVRARQPDGYHRIETVFSFAEDGDELSVGPADTLTLEITGPFAGQLGAGDDNLVVRAAQALRGRYGVEAGAAIVLDKRLPVASGLGGGSADAAATLRLLARWWGLEADEAALLALAASLGSDVPACLASRTARGEGRGDALTPLDIPGLSGTPLLLVNPRTPVPTSEVFRRWDGVDGGALGDPLLGRNDLEEAAMGIAPAIRPVLVALRASRGVSLARMSGSGATCFALFPDEEDRDEAQARLAGHHPAWWTLASRVR
jgi:4-diphosphocytidyl-2-C-methyl-D-erythritol kinase